MTDACWFCIEAEWLNKLATSAGTQFTVPEGKRTKKPEGVVSTDIAPLDTCVHCGKALRGASMGIVEAHHNVCLHGTRLERSE